MVIKGKALACCLGFKSIWDMMKKKDLRTYK